MGSLEYTFDKFRRISDPEFLLCTPLLAEVMGAGFDKAKGSMVCDNINMNFRVSILPFKALRTSFSSNHKSTPQR